MLKIKLTIFFASLAFLGGSALEPERLAFDLYKKVDERINQADRDSNAQFAFLYLHPPQQDDAHFTNAVVNELFEAPIATKMPPIKNADIWPPTTQSNMRVAGVKDSLKEPGTNKGHSEWRLLQDFNAMVADVFPGDACPDFIILGTRLFPCFTEGKGTGDVGCGIDYASTTKAVFDRCAQSKPTKFLYLYSNRDAEGKWNVQRSQMAKADVKILYGP